RDNNHINNNGNGSISIAIRENIVSIDPHNTSTVSARSVQNAMYERLFALGEDGELHPLLAIDYEQNEDATEYTFKLREDVMFHDGSTFNAKVVKVNFDRILNSEGSFSSYRQVEDVETVEIIDDYTVKFILKEPNNQFLAKVDDIRIA